MKTKMETYCLNNENQAVIQEVNNMELTAEQEEFMIESQIEQARLYKNG